MFEYCEHCKPAKVRTHIDTKLGGWLHLLLSPILAPTRKWRENILKWIEVLFLPLLLCFRFFGIVQLRKDIDESNFKNRTLIFWREAQRRGIDIRAVSFLKASTNDLLWRKDSHDSWQHFDTLPSPHPAPSTSIDNKWYVKNTLKEHGVPVPNAKIFQTTADALKFADQVGFPLVIKPINGSLSKHVSVNIQTTAELNRAVTIAQKYSPRFLTEKHVPGELFRVSVIGQSHVFVCQKAPAHVIGDDQKSLAELITQKNQSQNRGGASASTTLHAINAHRAARYLQSKGKTLAFIPETGERVRLAEKITLAAGCDITEITESVHEDNVTLFKKAARVLEVGLVGFDVICEDVTKSWQSQECGIIEANSRPYVDMHQHPSRGKSQPIAKTIWDEIT